MPAVQMILGTQLAGLARTPMRSSVARSPARRTPVCASSSSSDFTPEQQRAAMEQQLRLSAERATAEERRAGARRAATAGAEPHTSVIPKRKQPRRAARLAAAAAAAEMNMERSTMAQHELAARLGDLDEQAMAAALRAQLKQCGTFDESDPTELLAQEVSRRTGNGAAHHPSEGTTPAMNGAMHGAPLAAGCKAAAAEAAGFEEGPFGTGACFNLEDMLTA